MQATEEEGVFVGKAHHDECEQMARLEFASFAADKTSIIGPLMFPPASEEIQEQRVQERAQSLRKELDEGKCSLITAKIGGKLVGYADWVPPGQDNFAIPDIGGFKGRFYRQVSTTRQGQLQGTRYWFLAMLVVDGAVWKRGIGRKLVQWGLDQAQQDALGPADVYLTASLLGEAFYWKLGFRTLGWDYVKDVDAPDGVCKWPFMIKRGKSVKVAPSSVTISPVVRPEDCKKIIKVHAASFAVDSYTPTSRLRNPPVSQEVKERQLQGQCRHMSKQVQEGTGSKYIKAEIDNVIVGYAEWIPRGEDTMEPLSGPDLTFNMRYVGQVIRTRRRVMEGKRYWYLICLAVDPAYFGGGIGRRLVQWGIDEAKKDDSDCYLETMLKNEAFYSKLGFKTIGWESIEAPEAPEGVCEWIYMIRKGRKGG